MPRRFSAAILLAILLVLAVARLTISWDYTHPDEAIPKGIVAGVLNSGSLDTNFGKYDTGIKHPMYNFSSYYLALSAASWPYYAATGRVPTLGYWRTLSAVAFLAVVGMTFALGSLFGGVRVALLAAALTASCTQLFQDSLYARPEMFFTLLWLASVYVSFRFPTRAGLACASLLVGLMLACKLSAAMLAPVPLIVYLCKAERPSHIVAPVVWVGSLVAGTFLGAPYAFVHPDLYLYGTRVLFRLYGQGGGPQGLRDGTFIERFVYLSDFLRTTIGPLVAIGAIAAVLIAIRKRDWAPAAIGALAIATVLYTGTRFLFAERNFSHSLPILFILAAIVIVAVSRLPHGTIMRNTLLGAGFAAAIAPMLVLSWTLRADVLTGDWDRQVLINGQRAAAAHPGLAPTIIWPNLVYGADPLVQLRRHVAGVALPTLIEFWDYGDRYTARNMRAFLQDYDARQVVAGDGPFSGIPPSGLQAYLAWSHPIYLLSARVAPRSLP